MGISALLILVGLGAAIWGNGLKMGIDFAGGVIVQVQFAQPVSDEALKTSSTCRPCPASPPSATAKAAATICCASPKPKTPTPQLRTTVTGTLAAAFPGNPAEIVRLEIVGPKVGADLTNKALSARTIPFCSLPYTFPAVSSSAGWPARLWPAPFGAACMWWGLRA